MAVGAWLYRTSFSGDVSLAMKIRLLALGLLSGVLFSAAAQAQTAIYGTFSGTKLNTDGGDWLYGGTIGVYKDHGRTFHYGLDGRGVFTGKDDTHLYSGLVGPRLAVSVYPVKPYVEALIGVGHAEFSHNSDTKFEYQMLGGVDYTLAPHVDWRVIEFSYGGFSDLNPSFNPKTISTGLVLRLR